MSRSPEQELDDFIDTLQQEHRPHMSQNPDTAELQSVARFVKGLQPTRDPKPEFLQRHYRQLQKQVRPRRKFIPRVALVASIVAVALLILPWFNRGQDVVLAMEQTVKQLQNYHGVIEKISGNAAGESQLNQRVEIWSEGDRYATRTDDGTMTVNNGEQHWTVKPNQKEVVLLPAYLDTHDFDLRQEAEKAVKYPHRTVGKDTIAGRPANRIEISPPGGASYSLWVDTETNLPVQLQTAMQKSVQTTYTFVRFEPNSTIPASIFKYDPPQGYKIVDQNPDKPVATVDEAIKLSGITPVQLGETPKKILANKNRIVFDYGDTVVTETKANTPFVLSPMASIGQASGGPLEVLKDSLRWRQNGLEIKVQGTRAAELAKQLAGNLVLPQPGQTVNHEPTVKVNVNLDVEKRNQQQVDAGSSPWQLDPVQVAFTFVATQMSPGGINGKPPLEYSALKMTTNTGTDAVVQVQEGPIKTVYLKRLVRQDESGIWTVVGYDPR